MTIEEIQVEKSKKKEMSMKMRTEKYISASEKQM